MKNMEKQVLASGLNQIGGGRETRKSVHFKKDMLAHHGLMRKSVSIIDSSKAKPTIYKQGSETEGQQSSSRNMSSRSVTNYDETSQSDVTSRWQDFSEERLRRSTTRRKLSGNSSRQSRSRGKS